MRNMTSNDLAQSIAQLTAPWEGNENTTWLASILTLHRNIEKFKFPGKMSADRRQQVINLSSKELLRNQELQHPTLLKAEEISPLDKEYLMEHFLSAQNFQLAHAGEAFMVDKSGHFLIAFNLNNHLQFTLLDTIGELEKGFNKLVKIETSIGEALHYAFSPKFGFLTADPHQCGTAFTATVYLQLPALAQTGELDEVLNKQQDEQLSFTGLHGNPKETIGDIVAIHNNFTLGITEENILSSLRNISTKLQVLENAARSKLKQQDKPEIKDHIARAYAVLIHSYQIETIEALNAISLIKLGVDLGWVSGISIKQLNHLFLTCRRAHLIGKISGTASNEEIPRKRADYIHKSFTNVTLTL